MSWILRHPGVLLAVSLVLVCLGGLGLAAWFTIRPVRVEVPDAVPPGFPEKGFSHDPFEALLERFVDGQGHVDYAGWAADAEARGALDAYLGALARYSPDNAPERFPDEAAKLAYWLYAYNACVIKGVLEHWPIQSVQDVKGPLDAVKGLGFFGRLRFTLGGASMSLYTLENGLIRQRFTDPRIHFALNCASGGCPVLRPELPTGEALEPFLAEAARAFVESDRGVQIDHQRRVLRISQIFVWYREDFINELTRRGLPRPERTLPAYIRSVASPERRAELEKAVTYRVEEIPYDWSVNSQ